MADYILVSHFRIYAVSYSFSAKHRINLKRRPIVGLMTNFACFNTKAMD
mgnify:CR=1 FL=1